MLKPGISRELAWLRTDPTITLEVIVSVVPALDAFPGLSVLASKAPTARKVGSGTLTRV